MKKTYTFNSEITVWPSSTPWYFAHVPVDISSNIKENYKDKKTRGFGSIRVLVVLGKTTWNTSIFPDKKSGAYLLPLKAEVRKKEGIYEGNHISLKIKIV